jgi:ribosomal-protein-alanine N-acetyltransferase
VAIAKNYRRSAQGAASPPGKEVGYATDVSEPSQILESSRLRLREFVHEDVDALALILSDAETMRYYPTLFDRAGVEEWIARNRRRYAANGHGLWAMILKSTGELIGDCGVTVQTVDGVDELEIGYHLRRDHWGQGYATEAAQACRDWAFANRNAEYVISFVRPENSPSRRVADRNGMVLWKEILWRDLPHCVYRIERS